jgi:transposase
MVPVPDEADEDARRCVRERTELISERVGLTNRTELFWQLLA